MIDCMLGVAFLVFILWLTFRVWTMDNEPDRNYAFDYVNEYQPQIMRERYIIPFTIVSKYKYHALVTEHRKMLLDLSRSGNSFYMNDVAKRGKRYKDLEDDYQLALARINGLEQEKQLYIALIEKYKQMLRVDVSADSRLMSRDRITGKFVPEQPKQKTFTPSGQWEDEPEEDYTEVSEPEYLEPDEPEEPEQETEPEEEAPEDSKAVRAWKMQQNGATKQTIANMLGIKVSSVSAYISNGKKELLSQNHSVPSGENAYHTLNGIEYYNLQKGA